MRLTTKQLTLSLAGFSFFLLLLNACKHEPAVLPAPDGNYPEAVSKIFITRCATAGCHNEASFQGAGNIRLDSWEQLFNGGGHGAVVIPYDIENSSLLYFINPDTAHGHTQEPRMPLNAPPLTKEEYFTIRDWVAAGAPDKFGNIPFGSNPDTRQKIYMTMQGCDLLGVVDAEKNVLMRYIRLGKTNGVESPHNVKVSPDGKYAYVCFIAGNYVQKIDTRTDQVVGEADITQAGAQWNVLHLSPDGAQLVVSDLYNGMLKIISTPNMEVTKVISSQSAFKNLHGIVSTAAFDTLLVTSQYGNVVYKIATSGLGYRRISIDGGPFNNNRGARDPHEIVMTPDYSKYFLTCEASNEVRVMDARADTLIAVFDVPVKPQEMAISYNSETPYVIVTCMESPSPRPGAKGAVVVIDYQEMKIVPGGIIYGAFYQPHGIAIDDQRGRFYVASANADASGSAPHHASVCGGRNGFYSVYDIRTLQLLSNKRYETSVFPYSADARFK